MSTETAPVAGQGFENRQARPEPLRACEAVERASEAKGHLTTTAALQRAVTRAGESVGPSRTGASLE
jgi:hypothetical protein